MRARKPAVDILPVTESDVLKVVVARYAAVYLFVAQGAIAFKLFVVNQLGAIFSYIAVVLRKDTVLRAPRKVGNVARIRIIERSVPYGKAVIAELFAPAAQRPGKAEA